MAEAARPAARVCALCGADALQQCSGCVSAYYCGAECQRTHWNANHKRRCRALAAEKRAAFDTLANRARLFSAALQGDAASVLDLTERGANANFTEPLMGATPLFAAAQEGHYAVVRALLDAGADKDLANNVGATPLFFAAQMGREAIVRALLDAGADKTKMCEGKTAHDIASKRAIKDLLR